MGHRGRDQGPRQNVPEDKTVSTTQRHDTKTKGLSGNISCSDIPHGGGVIMFSPIQKTAYCVTGYDDDPNHRIPS